MLKKISLILFLFFTLNSPYNLGNSTITEQKYKIIKNLGNNIRNQYYMVLDIPKINLYKQLYNDKRNNVELNVEVLEDSILPPNKNSIIILASHSGSSKVSYFNNLIYLDIKDNIKIHYQNKIYNYQLYKIEEHKKTGKINTNLNIENELYLVTCKLKSNKQLLYKARLEGIIDKQ